MPIPSHVGATEHETGVTLQGRKGIAICLGDLSDMLTSSSVAIRDAVKVSKSGAIHDFVPQGSDNCFIRRGTNSHLQKNYIP